MAVIRPARVRLAHHRAPLGTFFVERSTCRTLAYLVQDPAQLDDHGAIAREVAPRKR